MFYRVQCVDRATGDQSERLYHAASPEQAAKMAMADGFVVGGVRPDVPPAAGAAAQPVAVPAPSPRLAAAARRTHRPDGLIAFFSFEMLIFPLFVKWLFILFTGLTVIGTVAGPILWLIYDEDHSSGAAMALLTTIGTAWAALVGLRLLAEAWVILFSIHERLRELVAATTRRE